MNVISIVVLGLCVSQAVCKCINFCGDNSEECLSLATYEKLILQLKKTDINVANVTLQSQTLTDVVHFGDLSPTLLSLRISGGRGSVITCMARDAGFYFDQVQNLSFINITLTSCGFNSSIPFESFKNFRTALYFMGCSHVFLSQVVVENSKGSGVTMFNNKGNVLIQDSTFDKNSVTSGKSENGGNGFYLLLSNTSNSEITFQNCEFSSNKAGAVRQARVANRFGVGGGMFVSIAGRSSNNHVLLKECTVSNNEAVWGGGLYFLYFGTFAELNTIEVVDTHVTGNRVCQFGGGGMDIGYVLSNHFLSGTSYNTIEFKRSNFSHNSAFQFGGGAAIYGTRSLRAGNDSYHVTFEHCEWVNNTAISGAAFDIAPIFYSVLGRGVFPSIYFTDCHFRCNHVMSNRQELGADIAYSKIGSGTIFVEGFQLTFQGCIRFEGNNGSALVLSSATADFLVDSNVHFLSNVGRNGGAIAMYGLSSLLVQNSSVVHFESNRARFKGGALYVSSSDIQDYTSIRTCFILFNGESQDKHNISFTFKNNTAGRVGNDVYASSIQACCSHSSTGECFRSDPFNNIGTVNPTTLDLVTDATNFSLNETGPSELTEVVPGDMYYNIPIIAKDEYGRKKDIIYEIVNEGSGAPIRPRVNFIIRNRVQFIGSTAANSSFRIESAAYMLEFNVSSSLSCPPGYTLYNNESCICGARLYFGIAFCNMNGSYLINGFWIGTCFDDNNSLCTAHCPLGFCNYNQRTDSQSNVHLLPSTVGELNQFSCGSSRQGVVCGSCQTNYSAYYHSYKYACGSESHICKIGILLYFISELLPLTVMFLIVLWFEINFTSGTVNGFILFAQVLDSISIDANGVIGFPDALQIITDIHRFLYRTFNFDFFSIERFSFCLWHGATVLDAMAMKYVTVFYAILLLVVVVFIMNFWKCSKRACYCLRYRTLKSTVIHGLTAFAVICYSQCARISFQIITPTVLYSLNYTVVRRVVFRRGDFSAFDQNHLRYAFPALLILTTMSLLPFFLILYPLVFRLLAYCGLSESMFANLLSRLFPIPLLDAFQSSFKDRYRFFAGFYFLYRLFSLLTYAFSKTLVTFYTLVELQLVIILALHAIVQPYKNRWHNVIDSLIFSNLAIINGITLYNYITVIDAYGRNQNTVITATASIQALLIYMPLLVLIVYLLKVVITKMRARVVMDIPSDTSLIDSVNLPPLRSGDDDGNFVRAANEPFLSRYKGGMQTNLTTTDTY